MQFEDYHPLLNLLFFTSVIFCASAFLHPVFLAVGWLCAFAYAVKKGGWKTFLFGLCLLPLAVLYGFYYASYNHFGVTDIREIFSGNMLTLESLLYGLDKGLRIMAVILWSCCVFAVFTSDKVVYLFGKVSPRLSLFLSISLRSVPRIIRMGKKINISQQGIGRGTNQGNLFQRVKNFCRLLSILITWTLESMADSSDSMRSRGVTLRGRTAFSIYRFDNRDRLLVIVLFSCFTLIGTGWMLDQMFILFDPRLRMNRITPLSFLFYFAYLLLCCLPLALEIVSERKFERLRASV